MGKYILVVLLSFVSASMVAQSDSLSTSLTKPTAADPDTGKVYYEFEVDNKPEFPGGVDSLRTFWLEFYYPKKAYANAMVGTVFVNYVIDTAGNVVNVNAHKSSGYSLLDSAATMYVANMPKWTPAMLNGKAIAMKQKIAFVYDKETYNTFSIVEEMPQYPGGRSAYDVFIASAPAPEGYTKKDLKEIAAYVEVIINKQGKVVFPLLVRSSGDKKLDQIALKYVADSPDWTPGAQRGKKVQVTHTLRIAFVPTN